MVDSRLTQASLTAGRAAALEMLAARPGESRKTVGAVKAYEIEPFIEGCRDVNVTAHVARETSPRAERALPR